MSGPKTSRHTLTPEQRKQLEERLKKMREEKIRREKILAAQKLLKETTQRFLNSMLEIGLAIDTVKNDVFAKKIKCFQAKLLEAECLVSSDNLKSIYDMLDEININAEKIQLDLVKHLQITKEREIEQNEELDRLIVKGFFVEFKKVPNQEEIRKNQFYQKIQASISGLIGMHLSQKEKERLNEIKIMAQKIDNSDFLENYYVITVFPFVKECEEYNKEYAENRDEFIQLMSTYKALLSECGLQSTLKSEEFSVELMIKLQSEISKLQTMILQDEEESYISQCIDEAMDEMGYRRVGKRDVRKKSGKHFRHELYKFNEGTAVDITYSDDGQVIMELGAVDIIDRVPSEGESRRLTEDMESFCSAYSTIDKLLRNKGIVRKNISLLPASAEYAQVINKSDYEIENDMETFAISTRGKIARESHNAELLERHVGE